jgi:hypothetical protein
MTLPRRADHGWFYPEVVFGLIFLSYSMMRVGPVVDSEIELTAWQQSVAMLAMFVGAIICTTAVMVNTRLLPRPRLGYRAHVTMHFVGLVFIAFGVGSYAGAAVWNASNVWIPLSGLAVFLVSGAVRALSDLVIMWRQRHDDEGAV